MKDAGKNDAGKNDAGMPGNSEELPAPPRRCVPSSLSDLLTPYSTEQFLQEDWGRSFQHIPGWKGKFSELFHWSHLNQILNQHRLEPPRLRLALEGKAVPSDTYIKYQSSRRRHSSPIQRLLPTQLTEHLHKGATLVLDAVDELHEPLTQLAQSLERLFHARIQMNVYAGCKTSHGFDLHWDDHEVLILQTSGRKHWKVYRPTRLHPLAKDLVEASPPDEEPVWDAILEDGDVLYIPRGWWHVAIPLAEPTLHVTVGIPNPTGVDLLTWLVDQLRASEVVELPLQELRSSLEQIGLTTVHRLVEGVAVEAVGAVGHRDDRALPAHRRMC